MTLRSPIHDHHQRRGARFVDFGGWEMPVQYDSVLNEHRAVRNGVGVFDVSHLGRLSVLGDGATDGLTGLLCNDARSYEPGRTHYTMLLDEAGGILDDMVVWRWDDHHYWVMPNAVNVDIVSDAVRSAAPDVGVDDIGRSTVMLAVQGPDAPDLLETVLGEAPRRFRTARTSRARMAGTGYTGERGGEICLDPDDAGDLFEELVDAGAVPCGLGARDTLRLEAGLPLWGSDIDTTTTPLEAGLDFVVAWDHDFPGRQALLRQSERGLEQRLTGLVMSGRGIPRHGHAVRTESSEGEVTSGNISPMLDTGVALAYLSPPVDAGTEAEVEIRGRWVPATITDPPFHR